LVSVFYLVTEEFAGCGGLRPYQPEEKIYELSFHLRPAFWRQGLAEEAGRAVIAYAFETFKHGRSSPVITPRMPHRAGSLKSLASFSRTKSFTHLLV
jgi:GNAT acetyltransferase-like protein